MSEEDQPGFDARYHYANALAPSQTIPAEPYPGQDSYNLEQPHNPHFQQPPPPHSQPPSYTINPVQPNIHYQAPQQGPFQQGPPGYGHNETGQFLPQQQLPHGQMVQGNPYSYNAVPPEDVVAQQPQAVTVTPAHNFSKTGKTVRNAAIVISVVAFLGVCWWILLFSIPGILLAMKAMNAAARGEEKTAGNYEKLSACITMSSVGFTVAVVPTVILALFYSGVLVPDFPSFN